MQIKTILVPCDFSEYAEYAFRWAVELAERWNARIVLFHVGASFSSFAFPESVYVQDLAKLEAEARAAAEKRLQEFAAQKGASPVAVETRVVLGIPFEEICRAAQKEHADLIVMGSHGRTGITHVLIGSVAERLVRLAPCPVLVARRPRPSAD